MKFIVTINRDEDGIFVVECPSIPGCISQGKTEEEAIENIRDAIKQCQGKTEEEAIENIRDAIKQCLEVRAERGMPLTVSMREVEVLV